MRSLLMSIALSSAFLNAVAATTINLTPDNNAAQLVSAAPAGSTFVFAPGTYRMQQIKPKTGDSFFGPASGVAILDGAQPITFTPIAGSSPQLWAASIGGMPLDTSVCDNYHPLCNQTRDIYSGTARLKPVATLAQLTATTWMYDLPSQSAIINFDPSQGSFEVGTAVCAFCGYANNVSITGVTVEHYASPNPSAAVGQNGTGSFWTLNNVTSTYNHSGGAQVGSFSTVENCHFSYNGLRGMGGHGTGLVIQSNEFSFNNIAGFETGDSAGGAKFGSLINAAILNNYSHDNNGVGLWDDDYSIQVTYRGNRVDNNAAAGIQHEIGYDALIEQNTLYHNGNSPRVSMWGAQIVLQNSGNTVVQNNKATVAAAYGSGLVIVNQDRDCSQSPTGLCNASNDTIQNNDVTFEGTDGSGGIMGTQSTSVNNVIDYNTYHIYLGMDRHHFEDFGVKTFLQMQASGIDIHGSEVFVATPMKK